MEPNILDRVVDFWLHGALAVKLEKVVEHADTPVLPVGGDVTDTLSTTMACIHIYTGAIQLRDDALRIGALHRLRSHLLSKDLGCGELLEAARYVYTHHKDTEHGTLMRRILVSALAVRGWDVVVTRFQEFIALQMEIRELDDDYRNAQIYFTLKKGEEYMSRRRGGGVKEEEGK
jgi:hypothetical protein